MHPLAIPSSFFLAAILSVQPSPPCVHFNSPPTPACGGVLTVEAGQLITFTVQASDETCALPIFLEGAADTVGSTFNPPLPTLGNPVSTIYSWIASPHQLGDNHVVFHAVSPCCESDAWCSFIIHVTPPSLGCTLTQGYWKTHACNWPAPFTPGTPNSTDANHNGVPDNLEGQCAVSGTNPNSQCPCDASHTIQIGSNPYNECQLLCSLAQSANGNAVRILSRQLIAAKLNILNGASSAGTVSDPLDPTNPYNGLTVAALVAQGDTSIGARNILTAVEGTSCGGPSFDPEGCPMVKVGRLLDLYNNGEGPVPHCP